MNLNKMNSGQNQVDRNLGIDITSLKAGHACQRKMLWSIPFSASLVTIFSSALLINHHIYNTGDCQDKQQVVGNPSELHLLAGPRQQPSLN